MNKKISVLLICLYAVFSFAGIIPGWALDLSDKATFTFNAEIDLTGSYKELEAFVYYKIEGSDGPFMVQSVYFNRTDTVVFDNTLTQNFITHSGFNEKQYFPNDAVIEFDITGENPVEGTVTSVRGIAVIPQAYVSPPGIEYYIKVRDSSKNISYLGITILSEEPASGQYIFIPVSNSLTVQLTPSGGTLVFPDTNPNDGETKIVFPAGAVPGNVDITVTIDGGKVSHLLSLEDEALVIYRFEPENFTTKKPFHISLLYPDKNDDGIVDGTELPEQDVRIYWNDGFEWRPLGGVVDPVDNVVTIAINHFTQFALFPAAALTKDQYRPKRRIITPALQDGVNDFAQFDNLAGRSDINIKIYDITGHKVRSLSSPYAWYGKDDDGDIVETGVYIYQFDVDGTNITGTIAVAK